MTIHLPVIQPQIPLFKDPNELPTGKCHVSFSEVHTWNECGWRHKLEYIQKLRGGDTEHTTYGGCLHDAAEDWLLNKDSVWFDWADRIDKCRDAVLKEFERIKFTSPVLIDDWIKPVHTILNEIPDWMELTFPGWQLVAAEFPLFEPIAKERGRYFKGFIDCVIKVPKKARKGSKKQPEGFTYWVLDWKTTSWGWDTRKKQDKFKRMQLALYKHFLSEKLGVPLEDIKCGFVLLKRTAKKGHCELVEVSVGDKTRSDALDLVSLSVNSINKKLFMKNRWSCRFCSFQNTPECP